MSEIIGASQTDKSQQTKHGVSVRPGHFGVDPGNAPVMSLKDFAKQ